LQLFCKEYFFLSFLFFFLFFSVVQQPNSCLGHLTVEVYRSHTIRHAHPVGLLWTSDQLDAKAAIDTTHNKHKRQTSKPSAGLKLRPQQHSRCRPMLLEHMATGIGSQNIH
jgi:hypothetical protein